MSEWRLFEADTIPDFTTPEFFAAHPHIEPGHQVGHAERMKMTADVVNDLIATHAVASVLDLGCGDGSLLQLITPQPGVTLRGYDGCTASVAVAQGKGLDVTLADIRSIPTGDVDLVIASEVIEHLLHPHVFVANIESEFAVFTSPAHEDAGWHYPHHAWAWDPPGYRDMIREAGWSPLSHHLCRAPSVDHGSGAREQVYQAVAARRIGRS